MSNNSGDCSWVVDSGATSSMCKDEEIMFDVDFTKKGNIFMANGDRISYIGIGKSKLKMILNGVKFESTLNNVLLAPQLDQNLSSVKRLCDRNSVSFLMASIAL